ncbi:MAG: hypothetical protein QXT93_06215 [Thermofilum sp.]
MLAVLAEAGPATPTITLSHYNSDPLSIRGFKREGVSVGINGIAEEKIRAVVVSRLKEFLENCAASFGSLERTAESLAGHWGRGGCTADEQLKAPASRLMLVRGVSISPSPQPSTPGPRLWMKSWCGVLRWKQMGRDESVGGWVGPRSARVNVRVG